MRLTATLVAVCCAALLLAGGPAAPGHSHNDRPLELDATEGPSEMYARNAAGHLVRWVRFVDDRGRVDYLELPIDPQRAAILESIPVMPDELLIADLVAQERRDSGWEPVAQPDPQPAGHPNATGPGTDSTTLTPPDPANSGNGRDADGDGLPDCFWFAMGDECGDCVGWITAGNWLGVLNHYLEWAEDHPACVCNWPTSRPLYLLFSSCGHEWGGLLHDQTIATQDELGNPVVAPRPIIVSASCVGSTLDGCLFIPPASPEDEAQFLCLCVECDDPDDQEPPEACDPPAPPTDPSEV